ncbi:MAG: hypothetical protein UMS36scaffold28_53 [Phage 59_13]|nr:MAG: hypothetical protein UMS36scaffold28_53 [Phage 59_13]
MSTLTPDPQNARAHDERNIAVIMESLRRYGQQTPLVVREGVILKGNATYEAAKRLGWAEIAAIPFDRAPSDVRGYKLADNRSAELAAWVPDVLAGELERLDEHEAGPEDLGWNADELKALLPEGEDRDHGLGPTPEDKLGRYETSAIKQIVLYLPTEQYVDVMDRLQKIAVTLKLETNTDVVVHLLDAFEKTPR